MKVIWHYHLALEFPEDIERLQADLPDHDITVVTSREDLPDRLSRADVVVAGPLSSEELALATRMKAHILPYAGANALPLEEYRRRGVLIGNSHGNARVVAERAVALALAVTGRIVEFHNDLAKGTWHRRDNPAQIFDYWTSILGARVTIVGTGAIGTRIASLLAGFKCHITGVRRRPVRTIPPELSSFDALTDTLSEGLDGAQLVFLCVPLSPDTRDLIGRSELGYMAGGFLVNVSRGEVVSESDLYHALVSGTIAGAALDTWWQYPAGITSVQKPSTLGFEELPNVVMSPHAASHTLDGKRSQLRQAIENVVSYCTEGRMVYPVDPDTGY
ncbi:MAG: 2-hydroxyacid dehydrogenase [Spirochaetaceae bacterium]